MGDKILFHKSECLNAALISIFTINHSFLIEVKSLLFLWWLGIVRNTFEATRDALAIVFDLLDEAVFTK